jgi:hypothetical protein
LLTNSNIPLKVQGDNYTSISSMSHTIAISNGKLIAWGLNSYNKKKIKNKNKIKKIKIKKR